MKNLPDDQLMKKLKAQLQRYEEQPDEEVWDGVVAALRPEPGWVKTVERTSVVLLLLILSWSYFADTSSVVEQGIASNEQLSKPEVQFDSSKSPSERISPHTKSPVDQASRSSMTERDKIKSQLEMQNVPADSKRMTFRGATSASRSSINPTKDVAFDQRNEPNNSSATATNSLPPSASPIQTLEMTDASGTLDSMTVSPITPIVLSSLDSLSQLEPIIRKPERRRQNRLRVYGMVTPSLTFQHVVPSSTDDATFLDMNSPGVLSKERISFSFEGGVQFPIGKRLAAYSGISYYQQFATLSLNQLTNGTTTKPGLSGDFNFQPNSIPTNINYHMQNVGLTAGISYVVSMGKIVHQFGAALQYEYGILQRSSESDNRASNSFFNYRIFYRAEYGVNDRLSVFIQPTFARSLLYDDVLDGAIRVKQSRAGIGIGVLYRMGNR